MDALGAAHAGLGRPVEAFDCLERALAGRSAFLLALGAYLTFDPLRADPRWADLARRVGCAGDDAAAAPG